MTNKEYKRLLELTDKLPFEYGDDGLTSHEWEEYRQLKDKLKPYESPLAPFIKPERNRKRGKGNKK